MKLTSKTSGIRTIRSADPDFIIRNDLMVVPRAGFEVSDKCPAEYKCILLECINNKWLLPVAHVKDSELFWDAFSK
jgi:hypothetical protein